MLRRWDKILSPEITEGIHQVIGFKHGREVVDLNHMGEIVLIEPHVLKGRVVMLHVLNAYVFLRQF